MNGIEREKRTALLQGGLLSLFSLSVGIGVPILAGLVSYSMLIILIPILALLLGTGMKRGYRLLQDRWSTFQIILSSESIIRNQSGVPDIEINRGQVERIQEKPSGLLIQTSVRQKYIYIPKGLEGYEEAKSALQRWMNIEQIRPRKDYQLWLKYILLLVFMISFGIIFLSDNEWMVITAGVFIILYTIWGQVELHKNPQIDRRVKFSLFKSVLFSLMMAGIVAGRIYFVLSK